MKHLFYKIAATIFFCITIIGTGKYNFIEVNAQEHITVSNDRLGDVNNSGDIELDDAQLVLQASLKIITINETDKIIADVNKDGEVTLEDAQLVLKKALKIIDSFFEDSNSTDNNQDSSDDSTVVPDAGANNKNNCLKLKEYLRTESIIHNLDDVAESVIMISFDEETDEFQIIHTNNLQENGELNEGYIMSLAISTDENSVVQGEYIYNSESSNEKGLTYIKFNAKEYSGLESADFYDTETDGISVQELENAAIDILDFTISSANSLLEDQFDISLHDIGFSVK